MTIVVSGLDIAHRIEQQFPDAIVDAAPEAATVRSERLVDICTYLRDEPELKFEFLSALTAVDRLEYFEVVYHLTSIRLNMMTAIKLRIDDRENPRSPSVTSIWAGANLQEREAYDLMGIVFEGHPDMRRVFLWDGFDGFPLRKDYLIGPGGRFPGLERFPGDKASRLRDEASGLTIKSEPFVVNLGPQHPSTHGVFRLRLTLDGEKIIDADMVMGYLHRSMEKLAEERTYTQNIPFTDRTDYLSAMTGNLAYVLAVEKLCGIEAPERAHWLRTLMCELQRIASHCMAVGIFANDCGAWQTPVMHMMRDREKSARPVRDGMRGAADAELHAHRRCLARCAGGVHAGGEEVHQGYAEEAGRVRRPAAGERDHR